MKLRIRSLESKQILRIEVPEDSSLQHLKYSIAQAMRLPSPLSLRLSLNRTHELSSSSPQDSLATLGIASGDLIFYSLVPAADSQASASSSSVQEPALSQAISQESSEPSHGKEIMEEDNNSNDESGRFPESCFLKRLVRVLSDEIGEKEEQDLDHKLIVCAVHSVFVESGFVGKKLRFPSSMAFTMSLHYTLPEILSRNGTESVVLKLQTLNNFINIYGSSGSSSSYRICLDERRFVPAIASLLENREDSALLFELWKTARDGLALPLMIELCDGAGLPGPACLARLPSELQTRILELLPGDDVARAGCACKDLHYLTRNDNGLWRRKFAEEFPGVPVAEWATPAVRWRSLFAERWRGRRQAEDERRRPRPEIRGWHVRRVFLPVWVGPPPHGPFAGGDDYDRVPWPVPFGRQRRGNFSPHRNFRGGL